MENWRGNILSDFNFHFIFYLLLRLLFWQRLRRWGSSYFLVLSSLLSYYISHTTKSSLLVRNPHCSESWCRTPMLRPRDDLLPRSRPLGARWHCSYMIRRVSKRSEVRWKQWLSESRRSILDDLCVNYGCCEGSVMAMLSCPYDWIELIQCYSHETSLSHTGTIWVASSVSDVLNRHTIILIRAERLIV